MNEWRPCRQRQRARAGTVQERVQWRPVSSAQGLPLSQVGEESQAGEGRGSMGGEVRSDRRKRPAGEREERLVGER